MPEPYPDQLARVRLMTSEAGAEQWDLSENDQAALTAVLRRVDLADEVVAALKAVVARYGPSVTYLPKEGPWDLARAALAKAEGE